MSRKTIGVLLVLLSALGYGFMSIFAKFAYRYGISVSTLLIIRFGAAAACFFIYMAWKRVRISLDGKSVLCLFVLGGICYTAQANLFFNSVRFISPSLAGLLLYTYPFFVSILSFLVLKEKLGIKGGVAMLLSFAGLVAITGVSVGSIRPVGMLLAGLAAIVYSLYIVLGNHVVKQIPSLVASGFVTLFAAVGVFAVGLFSNAIDFTFNPTALLPVAGIVFFSTILAIFTFFKGLDYLGPTKASIISMMEPIFTILFSAILLGDLLTLPQMAGGAVVMAGAVLVAVSQKKETSPGMEIDA